MQSIIIVFALFFWTNAFGQVNYDRNVVRQYESLQKELSLKMRKELLPLANNITGENSLAFITQSKTDTLNKDEQKQSKSTDVVLIDLDPETNKPLKSKPKKAEKENDYSVVFCYGSLLNDTLVIQIGEPFFGQTILHFIVKKNVTALYNERLKYDTIFKASVSDSLTNNLTISVKTMKFILSDSNFAIGKTIYGVGEIISNPYFKKDTWEENNYFELRQRMKYCFKFRVTKTAHNTSFVK